MSDSYREVTSESWGSRLMSAIGGVLIGILLFLVSFPLLFWNEGRAVQTARSLEEGASNVVTVGADKVEPGNDGKLVHVSGMAATKETLADPQFGVSANAIRLRRIVEMRQWKEESESKKVKKLGGKEVTETVYTYTEVWSPKLIDSTKFKERDGHENPATMPFESQSWEARAVTLGAFELSPSLIAKITSEEALPVGTAETADKPVKMSEDIKTRDSGFYRGKDPANPAVGDLRIEFKVVKPETVSVIARQVKGTFEPYPAKAGDNIELLQPGTHSAEAMFQHAQEQNAALTWILRGAGFLAMAIGLGLIFRPLVVIADVVPLFGDLLQVGVGIFALLVAVPLSLITISIAWVFYRPLIGIPLLVGGVAVLAGALILTRKKKKALA
jgi:hypothetical protein